MPPPRARVTEGLSWRVPPPWKDLTYASTQCFEEEGTKGPAARVTGGGCLPRGRT